jgi:hypothetical protein
MIGNTNDNDAFPPSGVSASWRTTVRAEHVGQVIIDAEYASHALYMSDTNNTRDFVHIDGIHFRRGWYGVFSLGGNYNYVSNCGFEDGGPSSEEDEWPIASISGATTEPATYNLVEDCWVWGKGRYGLYTSGGGSEGLGADHNVFRRVVVRLDETPDGTGYNTTGWVNGGFRFYKGNNNACQNCIMIDSYNHLASEAYAFATGGGSSYDEEFGHVWSGCMAINNPTFDGISPEDISDGATNSWSNGVLWGGDWGLNSSPNGGSGTFDISSSTFGAFSGITIRHNGGYAYSANVSASLLAVPAGGTAFNDPTSVTNTRYYLAPGASLGSGAGDATPIDLATLDAGLKYLPRIEPGSALAAAGVGATILYRVGKSGAPHGATNWDSTTTTELWPLPHEDIWAAKMKAYSASGPGGNRGFAALAGTSSTPLTDYVWGYLGNPKPASIY